ncbi:MAG: glycosyltransferase family 4 protein [Dehalococcoidia bacterium]|nr:glycosyltransferase family 4 protein [Dehalococcoidia bacterium]
MEEFSFQLFDQYPGDKWLVAQQGSDWQLPLLAARAMRSAWRTRGQVGRIHLGDALLAPIAPILGWLGRAPVSVTVHGLDLTFRLPGYSRLIAVALRRVRGGVIAVSQHTAGIAGARGVHTVVVSNGVDLPRFTRLRARTGATGERSALGIPEDATLIVTVGRLVRRKGAVWFAEQVLPLLPSDVVYAVSGDGPDRVRLEGIASRDPRVRVLGRLSDDDVDRLLANADVFVAPNLPVERDPEGFGIAPAEAAAAGLPVLVADLEGLRDMAEVCGVPTVPPADAAAWATSVLAAIDEPDRARPSRPVRDWSVVAGEYARVFAGLTSVDYSGSGGSTPSGRSTANTLSVIETSP